MARILSSKLQRRECAVAYLANEEWVFEASKPQPKHGRVDDDVTRNLRT